MSGDDSNQAKTAAGLKAIELENKQRTRGRSRNSWIDSEVNTAQQVKPHALQGDDERRLSRWFVSNQKASNWNEKRLNKFHVTIVSLLFLSYFCHILSSPLLKIVQADTLITILIIVEILCLFASVVCWGIICYNNASVSATKLLFAKESVNTYIYIFWITRSFTMELLKNQVIFSFVHLFHSLLIYSTDTWYLCNQTTLGINIFLFVSVIAYEFLVSISPAGPTEPSWVFMQITASANSLSRTNLFNVFVIFLDAFITVIYNPKRSKFVFLKKESARIMVEISPETEKKLLPLWKVYAASGLTVTALYFSKFGFPLPEMVYTVGIYLCAVMVFVTYFPIVYYSSKNVAKTLCRLIHEINVVFVLVVLTPLFYIDNIYDPVSAPGIVFPTFICGFISFDVLGGYFPKRLSRLVMSLIVVTLCWNVFNYTFLKQDCKSRKLQWGIFGEFISYCTIKRLVYQTILSLFFPALIATIAGRTKNTFFCTSHMYRSTGTIHMHVVNEIYLENMNKERLKIQGGSEVEMVDIGEAPNC